MTNLNPTLQDAAEDYLALRRSFGYRLRGHDVPLADFVRHLDQAGLDTVTLESAMAWAVEPVVSPLRHAQRLSIARGFATYLHALDPRCEVPPRGLLPEGRRRVPPHIYTADEIAELMAQSRSLQPPLRSATLETVIGLLVVTGMRSGEAVRLDRGDVDLVAGRVSIIATKFNKSRVLALQPTTVQALEGYGRLRDRRWPRPATVGFFVSSTGRRLSQSSLEQTFAVATLIRWHRTGRDVQALLPALSAQLGHVDPASTYWYLTAVPQLLALASQRTQAAREVSR